MSDFWVFGYGSLIWNPGFDYTSSQKAILNGYHRALCIHSWHYRGTKEVSGLVLGLDTGGSCEGLALKVEGSKRENVLDYLRKRELISDVYREVWTNIELVDGSVEGAVTYVAAQESPQYLNPLNIEDTARVVKRASGVAGPNSEYVLNTVASLQSMGIKDPNLEAVCALL